MSRIGFQFNAEDEENMFEVFDKHVDSSKEKITQAADKLLKLYKSKNISENDRVKLMELEKRLRLIFKEVDEIDKEVEDMARDERLKKEKGD